MSDTIVQMFVESKRNADDYLYLLLDPLAECDNDHPLHIASLMQRLGDDAIVRVQRLDLAHDPDTFPALVTLAQPGNLPDDALLALSYARAQEDARYRKRYVCGWLTSHVSPEDVATQLTWLGSVGLSEPSSRFLPFFEPLRLELLAAALRSGGLGRRLWPIRQWLCPTSWGGAALFSGHPEGVDAALPDVATQAQQDAPLVADVWAAWRRSLQVRLSYAPNRWHGDTLLPPQAAASAFRLIRDARVLGLRDSGDIVSLALHRFLVHPRLHEHPQVRADIARAARRENSLQTLFEAYNDATWAHAVAYLNAQRDDV